MMVQLPGPAPPSPLIVFYRGGVVPQIVSSGPDMPVFFRTSPFLAPKVSPYSLNGFELVVDIKFDEIESESYVPKDWTTEPLKTNGASIKVEIA